MRNAASATIAILLIATGLPLGAQGWIVPRPCGMGIIPADSRQQHAGDADSRLPGEHHANAEATCTSSSPTACFTMRSKSGS